MTNKTKIYIGIGSVVALVGGYFIYKALRPKKPIAKDKDGNVVPSNPPQIGGNTCPNGQELQVNNCIQAPCPSVCVDTPKSKPKKIMVYNCKDGFREDRDETNMENVRMVAPCLNHGGILNYMPIENVPQKGWCPTGYKYNSSVGCVSLNKNNGMLY